MATVCPLGLCRTEEDCPNAPCTECMRRLGEHLVEELQIIQRQARIALARGDIPALTAFRTLLQAFGSSVTMREMSVNAALAHAPNPYEDQALALSTLR